MYEIAARLNRVVIEKHPTTHDVDFVFIFDITHSFDQIARHQDLSAGRAELDLPHAAGRWLFYSDAGLAKATIGNPLENPAHAVYRPWVVEVRFIVFSPPELHLVRLEPRNKEDGITGLRNKRSERAFGRKMEVASCIDDVHGL